MVSDREIIRGTKRLLEHASRVLPHSQEGDQRCVLVPFPDSLVQVAVHSMEASSSRPVTTPADHAGISASSTTAKMAAPPPTMYVCPVANCRRREGNMDKIIWHCRSLIGSTIARRKSRRIRSARNWTWISRRLAVIPTISVSFFGCFWVL
jgi:hypothetical protein